MAAALPSSPPRQIGPLRIIGKLGQGGMGEVYRAWDERLGREVAVKLIRSRAAEDAGTRERFRREAGAAASLDHPATVRIHEILATAEGDAIVMELVAGGTLAALLRGGPLPPDQAARLGGEIAGGLAAAHALGIVHRDLKSENVMVTPDGHARILDFGLAKRPEDGPGGGLTPAGDVLGTYRAMSPEQARGLGVDGRSDLFSLGTLLYETVTGRSPFLRATPLDTLTSVCTVRQAPARALRPEVPEALSELIDRLLEKEPAHRPQTAGEVAAALGASLDPAAGPLAAEAEPTTVIAGSGLAALAPAPPSVTALSSATASPSARSSSPFEVVGRRRGARAAAAGLALLAATALWLRFDRQDRPEVLAVAVLAPRVQVAAVPGATGARLLAASTRAAVLRGLLSLQNIVVVAPEQVDPVAGSPVRVARATAADELMTADLSCAVARCRVTLARLRGADGRRLWDHSFEAPAEDPYQIAHAVESQVHLGYPGHSGREGFPRLEATAGDYREYLEIDNQFTYHRGPATAGMLLDRLAAVCRRSPRFLDAMLLAAEILRYRFRDHRDAADLERAFGLLAVARRLAPTDPYPLASDFVLALDAERLDRATADVAALERLQPGDPSVLLKRGLLLERRGAGTPALAVVREACRRRPSWPSLMTLANMEYRLGESAAARRDLEELLRRVPGLYQPQSLLAQLELLSGSPDRADELYADLVRRSPQETEIVNLGTAYMLLRQYPDAEGQFRRALDLEPGNPFVTLNLADVLLLGGREGAARELYRRLVELTRRDPAAAQWQLVSARAQAQAHLGQRLAAVEAAQQVLALAPGNAQAMAEVAIVYAVIGDHASALWNMTQALQHGVAPRWFGFPWFDGLRSSPELQPLLAAGPPPA